VELSFSFFWSEGLVVLVVFVVLAVLVFVASGVLGGWGGLTVSAGSEPFWFFAVSVVLGVLAVFVFSVVSGVFGLSRVSVASGLLLVLGVSDASEVFEVGAVLSSREFTVAIMSG
jgi:hypothetical protein